MSLLEDHLEITKREVRTNGRVSEPSELELQHDMERAAVEYAEQLDAEVKTWCIPDPIARAEKMQRERIRHPKLIRDLLLDKLDTAPMKVVEIGGGPEPLSDLIPFSFRVVVDPNTPDYSRYFPCPDHIPSTGEEFPDDLWEGEFDLVICTNALDHVRDVPSVLANVDRVLKPGGYFAVMCAENNAITNPHPCHTINLTARDIHQFFDTTYETVWELTYEKDNYRYGWVEFQGKRGQPAFALLLRKCVGYD